MSQRIFISSVQREFAKERKALAEYLRKDAILGRFFDVFLFEEVPAMYLKGYIEKSGTGTGDMIAKCASWGVPAPEWYEDAPDDFRVVLKRPVPKVGAGKMEQESRVKSSEKTRVKSRGENCKKVSGNKGERTQCVKRGGVKSRVESSVKTRVKTRVETGVESSVESSVKSVGETVDWTVDWSVDRTCNHVLSILKSPTDTVSSPRNIRYCQDFYRLYSAAPILPQVVAKFAASKKRTPKMQQVVAKSNCPQVMDDEILQQLVGNWVRVLWEQHKKGP